MNQNIFRAYDIRGKYPSEVSEKTFFEIGSALGKYFTKNKNKKLFIGQDVRLSSLQLKKSFVKSLIEGSKGKLDIIDIGLSTTPMLNFCANKFKSPGAIITASHDPKNYNGLKVVDEKGNILSGKDVLKIINRSPNN